MYVCGQSSKNSTILKLIFWGSKPCGFCSVHVSDGFRKQNWIGDGCVGGWMGGVG